MTGNSITQSQGERSRTDQYTEDAEAEPAKRDSASRFARSDPPARHNFKETRVLTGRLVETSKMEIQQTYSIYLKSDPFQSILSPSVSAQEALSNHNKAMIPLFNQPVNHSNQPHTPTPSSGLCSAAPLAGLSSSARLHSFTNLNISPTSNYHQKIGILFMWVHTMQGCLLFSVL